MNIWDKALYEKVDTGFSRMTMLTSLEAISFGAYEIYQRENAMADKTFPLNAWYAAAWSHEIEHALAARKICGSDNPPSASPPIFRKCLRV